MKRALSIIAGVIVVGLVAVLVLLFTPVSDPNLSSTPQPTSSYDEAAALIAADQQAEAALSLQPGGASIAMLTGQRSDTAVVLFHGLTVVPEQFRLIGEAYRAQGYNVWIPRLPRHGLPTGSPTNCRASPPRRYAISPTTASTSPPGWGRRSSSSEPPAEVPSVCGQRQNAQR